MLNEDFNIDQFKKSWQEQLVSDVYNTSEIEGMLNKKSTNYVKYIFWISLAEFLFFAIVGICTIFSTQRSNSFTNILEKLGVQMNDDVQMNFEHLYFALKVFSLLITAIFVFLFYRNYLKIKVECNLKNFILQIIKFKRTVNLFIFTNIGLLIVFSGIITYFIMNVLQAQNIHLNQATLIGFITGIVISIGLGVLLIWLYYRIVYGIIMSRLSRNLEQLQKIEQEQ